MKSSYLKYLLLAIIPITTIYFGSSVTIKKEAIFAHAHAGISIPFANELNQDCSCAGTSPMDLHAPSAEPTNDYEKKLFNFVLKRDYAKLGWCMDKKIRDTGPFAKGTYFGVHPAVRMYYSPRMMYWLTGDPKYVCGDNDLAGFYPKQDPRTGPIPDGAIIIKEMFHPPGDLYDEVKAIIAESKDPKGEKDVENMLAQLISGYTIMVKDSKGSKDGWFWSFVAPKEGKTIDQMVNAQLTTYNKPLDSGFNLPCTRCHGSAALESTFSSLHNIKGFEEENNLLEFQTDVSWKTQGLLDAFPLNKLVKGETCIKDSLTVKELRAMLELPRIMRPWADNSVPGFGVFLNEHLREYDPNRNRATANPLASINSAFAQQYAPNIIREPNQKEVAAFTFPFQWADHVPPSPIKTDHYITSDNCIGCHGGLGGVPFDVTMFLQTGPNYGNGISIAEYGEWRWSPMGLAGRDPIFYSMLESEMKFLERDEKKGLLKAPLDKTQQAVVNTCTSCHGAMGQRQLLKDAKDNPHLDPNFKVDYVYLKDRLSSEEPENSPYNKYGALAREGISCAVCHHITKPGEEQIQDWTPKEKWLEDGADKELAYFLFHNNTGRYEEGPADELYGPYQKVVEQPMENILGVKPVFNDFTSNSQMCGTCHTINLPNIGAKEARAEEKSKAEEKAKETKEKPESHHKLHPILTAAEQNPLLAEYDHSIEQATFLEWQNSAFGFNLKGEKGKQFQSCQGCHMPNSFQLHTEEDSININQLTTKIASIQDQDYPDVEHLLPTKGITVQPRTTYKRHELVGINVFLLEMFDQFPDILGVDKQDFMTSSKDGNAMAIEHMVRHAQENTVDIKVAIDTTAAANILPIDVTLFNKTGHRFPSGVSFRRAFLEVLVMDGNKIIWGSGRTNKLGVIVDQNGKILPTEFLDSTLYQPHYEVITKQSEVQIYEELTQNKDKEFTYSFIHRVYDLKDNRLLPNGWRFSGFFKKQGELMHEFMEATDPIGVSKDKDYKDQGVDFKGKDNLLYKIPLPEGVDKKNLSVKVTLYSQSIPPAWLKERFDTAPDGIATKRLYYMASHLNLDGTYMENWKLPLVTVERKYTDPVEKKDKN